MSQVRTSTINFDHFLDDLIGMYDCAVDEAVLVELIANSLDAKANHIAITVDATHRTVQISDNGTGMDHRGFFEGYHNFAFSLKQRGAGIGFAGLGAKLGLKIASEIVTETRSTHFSRSSRWRLREGSPQWQDSKQCSLTTNGTSTLLKLNSVEYGILKAGHVRDTLLRYYLPLFLPDFATLYSKVGVYPSRITFSVNGVELKLTEEKVHLTGDRKMLLLGSKSKPISLALFVKASSDVPADFQGLALCTFGKVIKRDWLDKHPRQAERITGVVEVPQLVQCLTTNKSDFIKHGAEGRKYYELRRAVQQAFGEWLEGLGEVERKTERRDNKKLEQMLQDILKQLPDFAEFFGARQRKAVDIASSEGSDPREMAEGVQKTKGTQGGSGGGEGVNVHGNDADGLAPTDKPGAQPIVSVRRSVRMGPSVTFVEAADDERLSWVDGNTVNINTGHPAYQRAERERSVDYHNLWAAATALVEVSGIDPATMFKQLSQFLKAWGEM